MAGTQLPRRHKAQRSTEEDGAPANETYEVRLGVCSGLPLQTKG